MPTLIHIENQLSLYADRPSHDADWPELLLYERMHTIQRTPHPHVLPNTANWLQGKLAQNALPSTPWQCVCLSWVLQDIVGHTTHPDPGLDNYRRHLHQRIVEQGQASLRQGKTGLLDGSALYLNYLLEQTQLPDGSLPDDLTRVLLTRQLAPLLGGHGLIDVDLSMHPGLTGLLLTLFRFARTHPITPELRAALFESIRTIARLVQSVDYLDDRYSFFPVSIRFDTREYDMRNVLSWAEGDLGVVLLLYRAARFFNDASLNKLADAVGTFTLLRDDLSTTLIDSPWLLRGAAGTAALYGSLSEISGNARYLKGQQNWANRTVSMLTETISSPQRPHSLFAGYAGALLYLHTLERSCRSDWKRLLLL